MRARTLRALCIAAWLVAGGDGVLAAPQICVADLPARMAREVRIPVGCEAIDCCPGCPAGPISWRIRVEGEGIEAVEVGLPGAEPVRVPPGETLLETHVQSGGREPAPLASVRVVLDEHALERWRSAGADGPAPLGTLSLSIDQLLGPYVIYRHFLGWSVVGCGGLGSGCDRIEQSGKAGSDASVILLDGRRQTGAGVCSNDEISRATSDADVGNLLDEAGCPAEVSILSSGNALAFLPGQTLWTKDCADTLPVTLDPRLVAPATFYFVTPDSVAQAEWGLPVADAAQADLALANQLYDANKVGIALTMTQRPVSLIETLLLLPLLVKVIDALATGLDPTTFVCALPASLESQGLYKKAQLNVYYLPVPGTGMICPDDRNVVFIGMQKKPETLAHEFGHALSLLGDWGHTNGVAGFDKKNVMWVRENDVRDHFSLGQAFRMSVDPSSMLNVNGVRLSDTRSCPLKADTAACPPLALDWVRP